MSSTNVTAKAGMKRYHYLMQRQWRNLDVSRLHDVAYLFAPGIFRMLLIGISSLGLLLEGLVNACELLWKSFVDKIRTVCGKTLFLH